MGGGAALLDADADGDLDAYLVQSGPLPGDPRGPDDRSRLFLNDGQGGFAEAPASGADNPGGYGMGAVAADYDNDGWIDLYVTNFGPDRLYRNEGSGRFRDVTAEAGPSDNLWSVSAAWGDLDGDGLLDLYVANYLDFTMANHKWCGRKTEGVRAYCHPDQYRGVEPRLWRNRGDGTFEDVTVAAGVAATAGKGLGVVLSDLDDDGDLDIFAANDSTVNYLWGNQGGMRFSDLSLASGAGYSGDGKPQACMGVDAGDYDRDGRFDLFVTNLDLEYNTLYRNRGGLGFSDVSYPAGVAEPRLLEVGFGTEFADLDLDGWLDLFVVNGHIIDNIALTTDSQTHAQPKALLRNLGQGRFTEVSAAHPSLCLPRVGRGLAVGDVDGDGDLDLLVGNNDQDADLYRNEGFASGNFLVVRTEGRASNRDGIGARLTLESAGSSQVEEVRAGTSYASSSDPRVTFGLGPASSARLTVRWPAGEQRSFEALPARRWVTVVEGDPRPRVSDRRE